MITIIKDIFNLRKAMKSERMNTMSYGRDLVDSGLKTDMTVSKEEINLKFIKKLDRL